ncbi:uncharacterized protein Dwil_GK27392 [Drosophila willistoni]|uniref:Uncharacterized protein n=1 Tax=Drosophila willistoni TaxID=7260 RepID=A0A0Q9WZC0_DROWI|nr:uncharacterized protein Dwil_GK27392 [Drosophila willistoni]
MLLLLFLHVPRPNRKHSLACNTLLRKSTEPPDERRGLLISKRNIPGFARRGGSGGGGAGVGVGAHTSAVQRQRELTISMSCPGPMEATITRATLKIKCELKAPPTR